MTTDPGATVELGPDEGWEPLVTPSSGGTRSFVSGDPLGDRLRVRYYRRASDGFFVGKVWFGPGSEGPPRHAHGGAMASVLDEAMGAAAWLAGHIVVAAQLTIRYRKMLPLRSVVLLEAGLVEVQGRKVRTEGSLRAAVDGPVFCRAEGLFIKIDVTKLGGG